MIRVGYFIHKVPSGEIIIRITASRLPKIGSLVVDSGGRVIGNIVDIIGPVREPYAVVKPRNEIDLRNSESVFVRPRIRRVRRK